jgi:hypothetical protein
MFLKNIFTKKPSRVNIDYTPTKSDEQLMVSTAKRLRMLGLTTLPNGRVIKSIPNVLVMNVAGHPMVFEAKSCRAIASILPNGMFNYLENASGSTLHLTESGRLEARKL